MGNFLTRRPQSGEHRAHRDLILLRNSPNNQNLHALCENRCVLCVKKLTTMTLDY
jgi:hypothetical protein